MTQIASALRIISAPFASGVRIAVDGYPWLSAPPRDPSTGRIASWSRYDSAGQTYYLAAQAEVAFAEVLSPLKRRLGAHDPLEADAVFLGIALDDLIDTLAVSWSDEEARGHDVVPQSWLARRRRLEVGIGLATQWIDVEAADSLGFLEATLERELGAVGVSELTTGILRGDQRQPTVTIGGYLRATRADEAGIVFGSKHGGGVCLAVWLGDREAAVHVLTVEPISPSDPGLLLAAERFGLRIL